jgi:enamine deaminase RidA (YjgF/YER057c/UK114 family)
MVAGKGFDMADIIRGGPSRLSATRSRAVIYNGVVTTVATAVVKAPTLYEQAVDALAVIDRHLQEAGTDKSRVLTVMVYITDIARKPEFNRAWDAWVDRAHLPMRACVGVALEGDDLVELVVTAAVGGELALR